MTQNINLKSVRLIGAALLIISLCVHTAYAQISANVSVNMSAPGFSIPDDFAGFSFETRRVNPDIDDVKGYLFDSANTQLVTLFHQIGIKSLRVGGGSVDDSKTPIPGLKDIDALFRFAKAADVKVIYSFPIKRGSPEQSAANAKYIWDNYHDYLDCFAIGNENENYPEYKKQWKIISDAIIKVVPRAKFCGPSPVSSMDGGASYINRFATDFAKTGRIKFVTAHDYPGGNSLRNATDGNSGRDQMLSEAWLHQYQAFYDQFAPTVSALGLKYKYDEGSSFYKGGAKDASNTFASSLWCLDYMHWWAAHGCAGYNFHNNRWFMYNITICKDSAGNYQSRPQGYGIKAFNIGSHGRVVPVSVSRTNMTAYGVVDADNLYLTIINKEHGQYGRDAEINIKGVDVKGGAEVMYLKAPDNDVAATSGILLGGATISNTGAWQGKWIPIKSPENASLKVPVSAASAAILKISLQKR